MKSPTPPAARPDGAAYSDTLRPPTRKVFGATAALVAANLVPLAGVLEADEATRVTLSGSASDPDGDLLTLAWVQLSGPAGVVVGSAFTTPEVTIDTPVTLALIANDGRTASAPAVLEVMVKNVNHAPTVRAPSSLEVQFGARATLVATAIDADQDPVTFAWTQRSGPTITLEAADAAQVAFSAPTVSERTVLELEVTARDALASSLPALVRVTVAPAAAPEPSAPPPPAGCGCTSGAQVLIVLAVLLARRARR